MGSFNENTVEQVALEWFTKLGYTTLHSPRVVPPGARIFLAASCCSAA